MGPLGGPELLLIFIVALIVFGPRKLPEIGKSLGKMMAEFRKASNDFRQTIESEVEAEKLRDAVRLDPYVPPPTPTTGVADAAPSPLTAETPGEASMAAPVASTAANEAPAPVAGEDAHIASPQPADPKVASSESPGPAAEPGTVSRTDHPSA